MYAHQVFAHRQALRLRRDRKRIAVNVRDFRSRKWQPKIHDAVTLAMHGCRGNREDFIRLLGEKGIDVVFRENEEGRIYGVTLHRPQETVRYITVPVWAGSFPPTPSNSFFNRPQEFPEPEFPGQYTSTRESLSDNMESAIEQAFGIFSPDINGPDPQEEALARRLQRKKKKKRRSRGIS